MSELERQLEAYSLEKNWLDALTSVIDPGDCQMLTFADGGAEAEQPRVEIGFTARDMDAQMLRVQSKTNLYSARYEGTISISVHSNSGDRDLHMRRIAYIRLQMSYVKKALDDPDILPFYQIQTLVEADGQSGLSDENDDEIVTTMTFQSQFQIIPTALRDPGVLTFNGDSFTYDGKTLTFTPG